MAAFNNCIFLYLGKDGICPIYKGKKKCYNKCDKFAEVTDETTEIYKDWQEEIEEMRLTLQKKYFNVIEEVIEA